MPEFAEILVNKQKIYTYAVPPELAADLKVGQEVEVPLRKKITAGYVLRFVEKPQFATLPIQKIVGPEIFFDEKLVKLIEYTADKYKCLFPTALKAVLPK